MTAINQHVGPLLTMAHESRNTKQRKQTMNTYFIDEEMLGDEATEANARRMVEILTERGYDVAYGSAIGQDETVIADRDWQDGLDMIGRELHTPQYDYIVIEDNGGGLHLFLFHPGEDAPAMGFTGFEYAPGSLITSLDSLDNGDDASSWDGKMDDAQAQWEYINSHDFGYAVICYRDSDGRVTLPEKMGRAGDIEFGVQA